MLWDKIQLKLNCFKCSTARYNKIRRKIDLTCTKQITSCSQSSDPEPTGKIDFPEFLSIMASRMQETKPEDEILEAFKVQDQKQANSPSPTSPAPNSALERQVFDRNGNGFVAASELRHILTHLGRPHPQTRTNAVRRGGRRSHGCAWIPGPCPPPSQIGALIDAGRRGGGRGGPRGRRHRRHGEQGRRGQGRPGTSPPQHTHTHAPSPPGRISARLRRRVGPAPDQADQRFGTTVFFANAILTPAFLTTAFLTAIFSGAAADQLRGVRQAADAVHHLAGPRRAAASESRRAAIRQLRELRTSRHAPTRSPPSSRPPPPPSPPPHPKKRCLWWLQHWCNHLAAPPPC